MVEFNNVPCGVQCGTNLIRDGTAINISLKVFCVKKVHAIILTLKLPGSSGFGNRAPDFAPEIRPRETSS